MDSQNDIINRCSVSGSRWLSGLFQRIHGRGTRLRQNFLVGLSLQLASLDKSPSKARLNVFSSVIQVRKLSPVALIAQPASCPTACPMVIPTMNSTLLATVRPTARFTAPLIVRIRPSIQSWCFARPCVRPFSRSFARQRIRAVARPPVLRLVPPCI